MKKWFCWDPSRETYLAILIGVVTILLSLLLNITIVKETPVLFILIRDILMIFGIGVLFTLQRIKSKYDEYGLTSKKLKQNLIINLVLAIILAVIMLMELNYRSFQIDGLILSKVLFIMLAGIFEVLLFYSYLRVVFEKSFGYVGAAILSSLFYSFHHAGFQPEFIKLFFVGISYVVVVQITKSAFSIYPFYWCVGATLDVFLQSQVVVPVEYPLLRSVIIILLIVIFYIVKKKINFKRKYLYQEVSEI